MEIIPYNNHYLKDLMAIWSSSVKATHHFLDKLDYEKIKSVIPTYFNKHTTHILVDNQENLVGFMVVDHEVIEALFIDGASLNQGFGSYLLEYAINHLNAKYVDVNQENSSAYEFYKKHGFETYEETEVDNIGMPYPLYKMRLVTKDCLHD